MAGVVRSGDQRLVDRRCWPEQIEEVNVAPAVDGASAGRGLNFGWSAYEGNDEFNGDQVVTNHHPPIFTYTHEHGCSISGGVRARGGSAGRFEGHYLFADYCAGTLTALPIVGEGTGLSAGQPIVMIGPESPTAVVSGPDGSVYVLSSEGVARLDG